MEFVGFQLRNNLFVAPMAGVTDRPFRQLCKKLGAGLLRNAMQRTLQAADIAGVRALAVHAKDEGAQAFYRHFDFIESPTDPLHLFILVKDLRRIAE